MLLWLLQGFLQGIGVPVHHKPNENVGKVNVYHLLVFFKRPKCHGGCHRDREKVIKWDRPRSTSECCLAEVCVAVT